MKNVSIFTDVIPNPFLLWNTKDIFKKVKAALFHSMKLNGDQRRTSYKNNTYTIFYLRPK